MVDGELRKRLAPWKVQPQNPPDFQRSDWQKIAACESKRSTLPWLEKWRISWLSAPQLATCAIVFGGFRGNRGWDWSNHLSLIQETGKVWKRNMSSPSISISESPQPKAHRLFVTVAVLFATIAIIMSLIPLYGLGLTSNSMSLGGIAVAIGAMIAAAIIMVENTRFYRDVGERDAKIRRLVDANIIGTFIWNLRGEIIEVNEAFLRMLEYSREDLVSGGVRWTDLTPVQWRDRDERAVAEAKATGSVQAFQKELFRKDGSRVPVLFGVANFEGIGNEGVAFVLDLSEQKRAEEALRLSEGYLAEARAELAHVTRVATLGEMTASIAHEINQPLAAVAINANASLRSLSGSSPNLTEAREAIRLIVRDGNRASQIIGRIRALAKKAPPQKDWLDLNETIGEVIAMARSEAQQNRVSLQAKLANDLPLIMGDKIQLQQVVLNLLINAIEAMSGVRTGPRELWVSSEKVSDIAGESEEDALEDQELADAEWTHILVAVRDSGPGLDPKGLDRLFDAFHTTKPQGLGMGLAISRSIVEAHEGRLWATANASRGAVFQFALPIRGSMPSAQLAGTGNALICNSRSVFAKPKYGGEIESSRRLFERSVNTTASYEY
jgi:PAS domain S-box-containing protein